MRTEGALADAGRLSVLSCQLAAQMALPLGTQSCTQVAQRPKQDHCVPGAVAALPKTLRPLCVPTNRRRHGRRRRVAPQVATDARQAGLPGRHGRCAGRTSVLLKLSGRHLQLVHVGGARAIHARRAPAHDHLRRAHAGSGNQGLLVHVCGARALHARQAPAHDYLRSGSADLKKQGLERVVTSLG